ncbi:conjugal transfer protein TraW [Burkholderia vietnamiensis]|uniref:conjugal transfer protein TraW n=1 Tax=Burkholderia vietnamiensis TaxID=60552 RepID=UPI001B8F973D|nr:conjugal transfer protein TraW [Burkholderia vietnamiensis]MBR8085572.1 conjugal transfer protein TraW [Burkholderia vietnamiensis]
MKKIVCLSVLSAAALMQSSSAYAVCDGCVVGAVQVASTTIVGAITALGTSLSTILHEIDTDVASIGSKVSDSIVQAAKTQREMALEVQRQQERDRVSRETELPIDPCATSTSNYAMQASRSTNTTASSYRPGGGASVSSAPLNKALNGPAPSVEASRRASAAIHQAKYCTAVEVQLGYPGCSTSSMPDADANADSLFTGAGMPGKDADLTFTKDQEEAARAYARMSIDPNPPENISKAEATTEVGKLYIAMQKAYQANMSSAQKAMNDEIASHMPFPGSAQLIQDIKQSDAAAQYFNSTASSVAKSTGTMSMAELMEFEAGRRWRNPYWQIEFAALADPTKLQREQLFVSAFMADLLHQQLQTSKHIDVMLGQVLAALARSGDRPALEVQLQRVRASNAR